VADFARTLEQHDRRGRQELELKCDGIAILTLVAVGLDTSPLTSGLHKMWRLNETLNAIANADEYPKMNDRRQLMDAVRKLVVPLRTRGAMIKHCEVVPFVVW
jgi:hypothetical protein